MDMKPTTAAERRTALLLALADRQRRAVVAYLRDPARDCASVSELAEAVARGDDRLPAVAIDLRHNTLPRLESSGVLEFDVRSSTVRYQGHDDLEALMDAIEEC